MRRPILPLLPVLAACAGDEPATYVVIDDFLERSSPVHCEAIRLEAEPSATELRLSSDSTWTVLDEDQRQLLEYDDRLRLVRRLELPRVGPGSALHPVSAVRLGDTAWAVAARGGLRIVLLSDDGRELSSAPLDFIPHSLEPLPSGDLLITALPVGDRPPTLLVRFDGSDFESLPVPRRSYPDMTVNALGNSALVEAMPNGDVLVVHQFMEPRAFRLSAGDEVRPVATPTPDGTRERIGYVLEAPITDAQLPLMLLPAMAMTVDPAGGEVFLLTRSGRQLDGRPERAVLRLGPDLAFRQGYILDVHAAAMVVLPRAGMAVVADDGATFHTCPLPSAEVRHARGD